MKHVLKRWIHIGLIIAMMLSMTAAGGWADEGSSTEPPAAPETPDSGQISAFSGELVPTGYTADRSSITKGSSVKISVQLKYADQSAGEGITVDAVLDEILYGRMIKYVTKEC